jgi:ankyrin repeat protein
VAAANGNEEMFAALLSHHASVDSKDNHGDTPLHASAFQGSVAIAELLLDHGADMNAKNVDGETPQQIAAENNQAQMAEFLKNYHPQTGHGQGPALGREP